MKKTIIMALAAIACLSTTAQKRAVTIPDVYRITSVSGVGLSPDGRQLVYSAGNTSLQTLKSDRRIVVSKTDGTAAQDIITKYLSSASARYSVIAPSMNPPKTPRILSTRRMTGSLANIWIELNRI